MSTFGERLRTLRQDKNFNQSELAKILKVTQKTISNYESNSRFPDPFILDKLASFFNVSVDYLLGRATALKPYNAESTITQNNSLNSKELELLEEIRNNHELNNLFL